MSSPSSQALLIVAGEIEGRMDLLRRRLAAAIPQLARGRVWCRGCGASRVVDAAIALRVGWPKCCGATMTIDAPVLSGVEGPVLSGVEGAEERPVVGGGCP